VSSAVMTRIENERDTEAKDKEFGDIWCKVPESKTHSKWYIYLKNYEATCLWKKEQI
jgi:hypothetical protein